MMSPPPLHDHRLDLPRQLLRLPQLKKELYEMGYAVAARPLMEGMPIGASPQGTKSSAQ